MHCCTQRVQLVAPSHRDQAEELTAEPGEEVITALLHAGIPAPRSVADRGTEGAGPFKRLLIKDVKVVDATGRPPYGPVHVLVEGNRIAAISTETEGSSLGVK